MIARCHRFKLVIDISEGAKVEDLAYALEAAQRRILRDYTAGELGESMWYGVMAEIPTGRVVS